MAGGPKVPVLVRFVIKVPVQVPVLINALEVRRCLQDGGRLAGQAQRMGLGAVDHAVVIPVVLAEASAHARRLQIPITVKKNEFRMNGADQPPDRRLSRHRTSGIAGEYAAGNAAGDSQVAGVSHQPADTAAAKLARGCSRSPRPRSRDVPGCVGGNNPIGRGPHQSADGVRARYIPGGIADGDPRRVNEGGSRRLIPHQSAHAVPARHLDGGVTLPNTALTIPH